MRYNYQINIECITDNIDNLLDIEKYGSTLKTFVSPRKRSLYTILKREKSRCLFTVSRGEKRLKRTIRSTRSQSSTSIAAPLSLSLSPLCYTKDVAIAAIDGGIATATATVASLPRTPFTALLSVRCCLSSAVGLLERAVRKLSISRANLKYLVSKRDEFIEFIEESDQATGGIHRWFRQLELVNM